MVEFISTAGSRSVLDGFRELAVSCARLPSLVELRSLTDAELLEVSGIHARARRELDGAGAAIAGELAHRSRHALGSGGLAQTNGFRTVEDLVTFTTGVPKRDAVAAVQAGRLLVETADAGTPDEATGEIVEPAAPWLRAAVVALASGALSVAALASIRNGLGLPNSSITPGQLAGAVDILCAEALAGVDCDRLYRRARELRDELDLDGIALREDELRKARGLRMVASREGGGDIRWRLDPEGWSEAKDLFDQMTSPKLGGVRFENSARAATSNAILEDERSIEQLASDGFLQLLRQGADSDSSFLLGSGAPIIRVTVAVGALNSGTGLGRLEGSATPVSIETVRRLSCGRPVVPVAFDAAGEILEPRSVTADDLGYEHRLFTRKQREALAVKFGGCMDPNCSRAPSWCEAHHVRFWSRDKGKTLVANGILLCRYHHLRYHNEGFEIERDLSGNYLLIPPKKLDPEQTPIVMPLKSAALRDLQRAG